jgi:hypothetical protein
MGTNNEPVGTAAANDKIFSRLELLQETSNAVFQFAQPLRRNAHKFSDVFGWHFAAFLCIKIPCLIYPNSP